MNGTKHHGNSPERSPAILVFDSFTSGLLLGVRGAGLMTRQMLYQAGDYNIDLSIDYVEQTQAINVIGQTMPRDADLSAVVGADVELRQGSTVAFGAKTNEFGEFIIDGIPEGTYDLRITLKAEEIDIAQFDAVVCAH